ncbi:hypothetical protein PybrP1_010436, partial [[Pythium] brassicae (nom. inval.)]
KTAPSAGAFTTWRRREQTSNDYVLFGRRDKPALVWVTSLNRNIAALRRTIRPVQLKALRVANKFELSSSSASTPLSTWAQGCRGRHDHVFHFKTRHRGVPPAVAAAEAAVRNIAPTKIAQPGVDVLYNADHTRVYCEALLTRAITINGTKMV